MTWARDEKNHEKNLKITACILTLVIIMPKNDEPTAKKIENLLGKLRISELKIKNERELELTVWGILCGRWTNELKFRREVGGRLCDITLGNVAVEIKHIKRIDDKDRCTGQVADYLTESSKNEVVIVALDDKGYLVNKFKDDDRVTVIRL